MSTILWVLFWIVFLFLYQFMFLRLRARVFYIGLAIAFNVQNLYLPYIEIPNTVFWVLFAFLLTTIAPESIGLGCFWLLISTRSSIRSVPFLGEILLGEIHIDPILSAVGFWLGFTLLPCLLAMRIGKLSLTCFVCWIAAALVMSDKITYPMSWGWIAAWALLHGLLMQTLPPEMSIAWHIF